MQVLLSEPEIAARLSDLPGWTRENGAIGRSFSFRDFAAAMIFVNGVAEIAEAANHHPDITIRWNTVHLRLSTHRVGGLTTEDFALAETISHRTE